MTTYIYIYITKPKIYVRYVYEIFIATHSYDEIYKLNQTLEKNIY